MQAGRADYVDEHTIEMRSEDRGHQAAVASASKSALHGGMATLDAIAGLPVLQPVILITDTSKSPRRSRDRWNRNGKVQMIFKKAA